MLGLGMAVLLMTSSACSVVRESGSAAVVGPSAISESTIQQQSAAFIDELGQGSLDDSQRAQVNRLQLTFQVRHLLIERAAAAAGVTATASEVSAAQAQFSTQKVIPSLNLQSADLPTLSRDYVLLGKLARGIPAAGVTVPDVSVVVDGVPTATRDAAVAKLAVYSADPARLTADVAAAGQGGVSNRQFNLLTTPSAGSAGLYSAANGSFIILPTNGSYLVARISQRKVSTAHLTAATLQAAQSASDFFDLAILMVPTSTDEPVSVNPRFGSWDPVSRQVVALNGGL
ncbi:hypothetical protein SAMN04515671_0514 [Nakamurella panacisegetis]|uniref:SurA N-terminal domain-containing protein n=2 Tax=Nakamurella panacisegetis TaxID=1090615 RepID=A0A1H0IID0_9ACTN|nr:hypothetical protein SAMN04515671_0514 [Nakamurella panacisegetis]